MGEHAAFFYGTLMVPSILYRVIYNNITPEPWQKALTKIRPALLEGYQRHRVQHADYPGIIPCKGASVRGSVCTGLTDGDIYRLDVFEGDEYDRVKVKAKILKDEVGFTSRVDETRLGEYVTEEVEVDVYVYKESLKWQLEEKEWDFDEFLKEKSKKWTGEELMPNGEEVDDYFARMAAADEMPEKPLLEAKVVNGR